MAVPIRIRMMFGSMMTLLSLIAPGAGRAAVPLRKQTYQRSPLLCARALWQHGRMISITRGDPGSNEIALTFDDGPHPPYTLKLLALLKRLDVPATFFVVGWKVDQAPWVLPFILRNGDEIGNHTYHHFDLKLAPPALTATEISLCNDAVWRACGIRPRFFRPSGGQYDPAVLREAASQRMITTLWTDDPADYVKPGAKVIESRLLSHIHPGAIILLHDGIEQTYSILPDFVARMKRDGYHFVTMSELAQHVEMLHHVGR